MWVDLIRSDSVRSSLRKLFGLSDTAIIWMTHFQDKEVLNSFDRLLRDVGQKYPVFGFLNSGIAQVVSGHPRLSCLNHEQIARLIPHRSSGMLPSGNIRAGYADAFHLAAAKSIPRFKYYWFVEYDVDFSGDWLAFFSSFEGNTTDLLATTLLNRDEDPAWFHWYMMSVPEIEGRDEQMRGFFPIYRASDVFIDRYSVACAAGWDGHFESLFPTLARKRKLSIEDIGGDRSFTPPSRLNKFYFNEPTTGSMSPGSFRFSPPISDRYFSKVDEVFHRKNYLWHPVKAPGFYDEERRIQHQNIEEIEQSRI